jgi:hypothetical protein
MPAPQTFGYGTLLVAFLTSITFQDELKYSFKIITTNLYIDNLYRDHYPCILITLYTYYIYVYNLPIMYEKFPYALYTSTEPVAP